MSLDLTVLIKGRVLARGRFDQSFITIGRSPESEVYINNLGISRQHATLSRDGAVWTLEDLKSASGTFVNGQRVQQWHLANGDRIGIGKFTIVFEAKSSHASLPRVSIEGRQTIAVAETDAPLTREERSPLVARLVFPDRSEHAIAKDVFTVGGAPDNDLVVGGWLVPPRIALITRGLAGFSVVNLVGHGWVGHEGQDVEWDSWIESGDSLRFGRTHATFLDGAPASLQTEKETLPCRT